MTLALVSAISLALGVWWGQRWGQWSREVEDLLEDRP